MQVEFVPEGLERGRLVAVRVEARDWKRGGVETGCREQSGD